MEGSLFNYAFRVLNDGADLLLTRVPAGLEELQ